MRQHSKQQGAALAISLILLVAMTILGVATLNGTRLTEKISSNAQQKTIVFETAESVINTIFTSDDISSRFQVALETADYESVPQLVEATAASNDLDQTNLLGTSVDVNAEAEIQFCGEFAPEMNDLNADQDVAVTMYHHFDIRVTSTIDNSRARAEHVLRKKISSVELGIAVSCVAPGE